MSYLGGSLQVIDIGTSTQRVCEPDAVGGPKNCLWNIGLPLRYLSIISRVTGNSGVKVSCAFATTNAQVMIEFGANVWIVGERGIHSHEGNLGTLKVH